MLANLFLFHQPIPIRKSLTNLKNTLVGIIFMVFYYYLALLLLLDTSNKKDANIKKYLYKIHKKKEVICTMKNMDMMDFKDSTYLLNNHHDLSMIDPQFFPCIFHFYIFKICTIN